MLIFGCLSKSGFSSFVAVVVFAFDLNISTSDECTIFLAGASPQDCALDAGGAGEDAVGFAAVVNGGQSVGRSTGTKYPL